MSRAVTAALKDAITLPRDAAAIQLVRNYARLIDAAKGTEREDAVHGDLGPKLLAALQALGMTLSGRSTRAPGGVESGAKPGVRKVDELRARRADRARRAASVDSPSA